MNDREHGDKEDQALSAGAGTAESRKNESYCLPNGKMDCAAIRDLLFDYMARELGEARSDLVRGHLLKCEACKLVAAEIQETMALLKQASSEEEQMPEHLTPERRAKVLWTLAHPLLDWLHEHHVLVSVIVTLIALLITVTAVLRIEVWREANIKIGPPVWIDGRGLTEREWEKLREMERHEGTNGSPRIAPRQQ